MKQSKIISVNGKTRKLGLFQAAKAIIFNQKGNVDLGSADAAPEASSDDSVEASESVSSESIDEGSDESSEAIVGDSEPSEEGSEVQAETVEELEGEIEEAVANGASEKDVQDMIRKFNIKVDGKEQEVEIDLSDEEAIIKELQLARMGQKRAQEKSELENATAQFLRDMRANPFKALKQLDPEFDEMSYVNEFVEKLIKENEMTPEEKEQARIREEYEQLKAEKERYQKEAQERKQQEEVAQILSQIKSEIEEVLTADEDLNVSDKAISLVAAEMDRAWKTHKVDLNPKQALDVVKKRLQKEYEDSTNMFKSTDSMKKYMGNNLLEKLREDRAKIAEKQQQVKSAKVQAATQKQASEKPNKPMPKLSDIMAGRASWDDLE